MIMKKPYEFLLYWLDLTDFGALDSLFDFSQSRIAWTSICGYKILRPKLRKKKIQWYANLCTLMNIV